CRTRVSQLLQLKRLPEDIRKKLEHAPEKLDVLINIHSLRKLVASKNQRIQQKHAGQPLNALRLRKQLLKSVEHSEDSRIHT
ncbi:hypothetical protein, partial [Pelagicoccus sp. SDUM812002]|uniref:hypothetical protein n=1 Tax=Pelagicoccus sp. SDUM812002 TaxID=3041266 RepID=UPI00280D3E52